MSDIDRAEAIAARNQGIHKVAKHTDPDWRREAKAALWRAIQARDELTTDDIDCDQPREPRAWGPIMLAAARAGLIENTYRQRQSTEATCHARPKTVWRVNREAVDRFKVAA